MKKLLVVLALSVALLALPAVAFASATSFEPAGSSCTMAQDGSCPMQQDGACAMGDRPCAMQGACGGCASASHRVACPLAFGQPALMSAIDCIAQVQAKLALAAAAAEDATPAAEEAAPSVQNRGPQQGYAYADADGDGVCDNYENGACPNGGTCPNGGACPNQGDGQGMHHNSGGHHGQGNDYGHGYGYDHGGHRITHE